MAAPTPFKLVAILDANSEVLDHSTEVSVVVKNKANVLIPLEHTFINENKRLCDKSSTTGVFGCLSIFEHASLEGNTSPFLNIYVASSLNIAIVELAVHCSERTVSTSIGKESEISSTLATFWVTMTILNDDIEEIEIPTSHNKIGSNARPTYDTFCLRATANQGDIRFHYLKGGGIHLDTNTYPNNISLCDGLLQILIQF